MRIDEGDYGEGLHSSFLFPTHRLSRSQVNGADDSAILASFLLDEKLGRLGVCGCACCIVRPRPYRLYRQSKGNTDDRSDP
jgi:hypothetical protein